MCVRLDGGPGRCELGPDDERARSDSGSFLWELLGGVGFRLSFDEDVPEVDVEPWLASLVEGRSPDSSETGCSFLTVSPGLSTLGVIESVVGGSGLN